MELSRNQFIEPMHGRRNREIAQGVIELVGHLSRPIVELVDPTKPVYIPEVDIEFVDSE